MKKTFLLLAAMCCLIMNAWAMNTYSLKIKNVTVTDANAADILSDGAASYDPVANVLTIKKDIIYSSSTYSTINSSIRHLQIVFEGEVKVSNDAYAAILLKDTTTLSCSRINSSDFATIVSTYSGSGTNFGLGIDVRAQLITFENFQGEIKGGGMAMRGAGTTKEYTLIFRNSHVRLANTCQGGYPLSQIANVIYENGSVLTNEGVTFEEVSGKGKCFVISGASYDATTSGPIKIACPYGITVKGVKVGPQNMDNVLGDGKVEFDLDSNVLYLTDVNDSYNGTYILAERDGVKLYAKTDCSISSTSSADAAIVIDAAGVKIQHGRWTLKGGVGINIQQPGCVIQKADLAITGSEHGITSTDTLVCNDSRVHIANSVGAGIAGDVKLIGCQEVWGTYTENHGVLIANKADYSIKIGGTQITAANMTDVLGDGKHVSLDDKFGKLTLTLDNATINTGVSKEGIRIEENNVTIMVKGTNHVCAHSNQVALDAKRNVTIISENCDTLYLDSASLGLQVAGNYKLAMQNVYVGITESVTRGVLAIAGSTLEIDSLSVLSINASGAPFTCNGTLTLGNEVAIQKPAGAVFDQPYIKVNNIAIANGTEVLICSEGKVPTDIEEVHNAECTAGGLMHDVRKVLRDGQLLIIRDGKTYSALGQEL